MKKEEREYSKRKQAIEKLPDDTRFYFQSYGFVGNAPNLWASGSQGYTTNITAAQTYSKEETLRQLSCKRAQDRFWTFEQLQNAVQLVVEYQNIKGHSY